MNRTPKTLPLAEYIARQIELCGKTQKQIAAEVGYPKPNIITMFKQGLTKVPLEKVPVLARSLGVDPAHMLRMALQEYQPEVLEVVEQFNGALLTDEEQELLGLVREASGGQRFYLTPEKSEAIRTLFAAGDE